MAGLRITVEGYRDLRAALRSAADATPREMAKLGHRSAARLLAATVAATPRRSGAMAASWRPFSNSRGFGVRSRHPGAGTIEFARTEYPRRTPSGAHTMVHPPRSLGEAPRMAYRAGPPLAEAVFRDFVDSLDELLRAHGWGQVN